MSIKPMAGLVAVGLVAVVAGCGQQGMVPIASAASASSSFASVNQPTGESSRYCLLPQVHSKETPMLREWTETEAQYVARVRKKCRIGDIVNAWTGTDGHSHSFMLQPQLCDLSKPSMPAPSYPSTYGAYEILAGSICYLAPERETY